MKTIVEATVLTMFVLCLWGAAIGGDEIDRTKRPAGKPAPHVTLPEIQKATLTNGLKVWLVERHQLPYVAFNLVIYAGADHDPLNQPGIATMTADVLDEGTQTRDALQISDEMESAGAAFSVGSYMDFSFMTLGVLTKHLDKALPVFADVLTHPTFPQKEFERVRRQRTGALLQQRDQPSAIASNAFSHILYGSNHPYGNNPAGTETSLKSMTTADLKKFYETYYRPNNATLVIVGDVTMSDVRPMIEKALAAWTPADVSPYTVPLPPRAGRMKIYLIDKPGAPQSEIRIGYPALSRSTPDYFPVITMNQMLGGQFTSRINLNLRERHGYTYGARTGFQFQKGVGPFSASAGVVTEKTDSSVIEFLHEISLMHEKGMTEQELDYAKKGMIGNFALSFETPAQISRALANIVVYGLSEDYYQYYLQHIEAVSLSDVNRVAGLYLDTSNMAVIVVGDLAKIKEKVMTLNLGDVIICDTDGNPLK